MFFEFSQNNSGGSFVVNDRVCHRLYIEAEDYNEARDKAEELGCYWDGVANGIDCPCCGDRWSDYEEEPIPLEKYAKEGYRASVCDGIYPDTKEEWRKRFGKYKAIKEPEFECQYSTRSYVGAIAFGDIEEYAQLMADEYGWTVPDARIFFSNGCVKEIFSAKTSK